MYINTILRYKYYKIHRVLIVSDIYIYLKNLIHNINSITLFNNILEKSPNLINNKCLQKYI